MDMWWSSWSDLQKGGAAETVLESLGLDRFNKSVIPLYKKKTILTYILVPPVGLLCVHHLHV